ncbi:hypothetical protein [Streptosporangium sp. NPDC048865]|uniref:hypothetical protein n=1 Tax=Streptosporangium sp. NPDC048865 TaxID=3155766 RepID=UPI003418F5A1
MPLAGLRRAHPVWKGDGSGEENDPGEENGSGEKGGPGEGDNVGGSDDGSGAVRLGDGTLPPMLGQGPSTGSPPPAGHGFPGVATRSVAPFRDGSGSPGGLVGSGVVTVPVPGGSEEAGAAGPCVTVTGGGSVPPPQPASTSAATTVDAARHRRTAILFPYGSVMVGRLLEARVKRFPHVHPPAVAGRYPTGV